MVDRIAIGTAAAAPTAAIKARRLKVPRSAALINDKR
jgi:hypothetical protein